MLSGESGESSSDQIKKKKEKLYEENPKRGPFECSIRACIFCPPRQTTLFREGPDDNGPVHLAHFTLPTGKEFWTTLPLLFFSELIGSAFINFPHFFIDSRLKHCAISEGLAVAGLVYAAVWVTYPLSGAQINPMITLAFSITRHVPFYYLPIYWAGQFSGALLALSAGYFTSPLTKSINNTGMSIPHPKLSDGNAMLIESLFTFLLIIVVCSGTDEMRDFLWTTGDGSTLACAYMLIYLVSITLLHRLFASERAMCESGNHSKIEREMADIDNQEVIGDTERPGGRNSTRVHYVEANDCGQATEDLLSNNELLEGENMAETVEGNLNNSFPDPAEVEYYAEVAVNSEVNDEPGDADNDVYADYVDDFHSLLLITMLWITMVVEGTMTFWAMLILAFS
ncbi:hypothetical protein Aperf_G00000102511 [Anoplocephala perfoliata]